jgi:hypothetical protein
MSRALCAALLFGLLAPLALADDQESLRRDVEAVANEVLDSPLPLAPFSIPRASYFYAALDVPPLESAQTLSPSSFYLRLRTTHARSYSKERIDYIPNSFEGLYHEWLAFDASWGIAKDWEVGMWLPLVGWDEIQDRFHIFDDSGNAIVRNEAAQISGAEASRRHDNFSVLGLRAKRMLLHNATHGYDLAASMQLKIPIGRPRDLTNAGTWDLVCTMLATIPEPWGAIHANLGVTFPLGGQNLFIPEANVTLNPFVHAGIAADFAVSQQWTVGVQLEANSDSFGDVAFLRGVPVTGVAGARWLHGKYVLEFGAGTGFDWHTSYQWLAFLSFGRLF